MLQLENNPLVRLNTTVGTAIKRTQEAQSAFTRMIKEQKDEKRENIYSNIDDMLSQSLKTEEE